jgi:hypothetical protein
MNKNFIFIFLFFIVIIFLFLLIAFLCDWKFKDFIPLLIENKFDIINWFIDSFSIDNLKTFIRIIL